MSEKVTEPKSDDSIQLESTISQIRRSPSVENWTEELNSILEKLRDNDISRLGDVSEHIEVIISGALSPQLAKDTFLKAFEDLLQKWQPHNYLFELDRLYYTLSLIAGFAPSSGFVKLAGFLKAGNRFCEEYKTPMGWDIDFQDLALSALKAYYPAPPYASQDKAYQTYIDILRLNFEQKEHFGSSAARLIDLKELAYNSPQVLEGISRFGRGLEEIVHLIFNPFNLTSARTDLGYLYAYCKTNELGDYFNECIKPYGSLSEHPPMQVLHDKGRRVDEHPHPGIFFTCNNKTTFEIALSPEDMTAVHVQIGPDLTRLKRLIEHYRFSGGSANAGLMKEIREELSAVIDKDVVFVPQISHLEKALGEFVELRAQDEDIKFLMSDQTVSSVLKNEMIAWLDLPRNKKPPTERDFKRLTDKFNRYDSATQH